MPPHDGLPDTLEACFPNCLLQLRVGPAPTPLSPQIPPGEPLRNPVVEAIQGPLHPRGKHPRLRPEQ